MPENLSIDMIERAWAAVEYAQTVRSYHRRRREKNSPQRKTDIALALEKLRAAMKPLKSEIGKFPYGPQTVTAEENRQKIRDASAAIQRERRKLWKMASR